MLPPAQASLSPTERKYVITVAAAGFCSTLLAFSLLSYILVKVFKGKRSPRGFVVFPITIFYIWLLFWETLGGSSSILNLHWVLHDEIVTGSFCNGQALAEQLANTGTALSIVAMSGCILHDYVISSTPLRGWTGAIGIGIISVIQIVDIALPNILFHGANRYYGIAGYWCWISSDHFITKIITEYLWFWIAWAFSFLTAMTYLFSVQRSLYLPVGLFWIGFPIGSDRTLRVGLFSIDNINSHSARWSFSLFEISVRKRIIRVMLPIPVQCVSEDTPPHQADHTEHDKDHAFKLLLYPLFYLLLIAPLSVLRFIEFKHNDVSFKAIILSDVVFSLSGTVDVILFRWTRYAFGLATSPSPQEVELDDRA